MQPFTLRRGFSNTPQGFTLLELLLTVALIGIIAALLMPGVMQARQEALRQTVRQQTKVMEAAVAQWFNAQPSLAQASQTWDTYASNGFIVNLNRDFIAEQLMVYLPDSNKTRFAFTNNTSGLIDTPEMQQVRLSGNLGFIGGSVDAIDDQMGYAHLRLFWDPPPANPALPNPRLTTSPRVRLFLPDIPAP